MSNNRIDQVINIPAIQAQFDTVFSLMDEMAQKIAALNKAINGINIGGNNRGASGGQAQTAINAADQLAKAQQRLALAESAAGKAIADVQEKIRQQNQANRQAARENQAHATSLDGLRARLAALTREYDRMTKAEREMSREGRTALRTIQQLQKEIRAIEQPTGRFQRNVGNYPQQLVGGISGFLGSFGVLGAGAVTKQVFDLTVRLDSLNSALRAVSGTEEEFGINQRFLIDTAERLGLNLLDLTQSYKLFYAASTQAGLSAGITRDIFDSVAQTAATLKLSTEDTQGVLLAFSQILGKGKVQAEELRGQIGERLPGAFSIAARSIGVTEQQLNKMLERGEVVASEFLPKFADELEKTFGVGGVEKVEGLQASINRLSNTFTELVSNNQSGLSRFFGGILDFLTEATKGFDSFLSDVQEFGAFIFKSPIQRAVERAAEEAKAEGAAQAARREALRQGNDAYIKEFEKASAEQRQVMLREAEKMAALSQKEADRLGQSGFLTGADPFQMTQSAQTAGRANRAQDAAFQEADRVRRYRDILAKEAEKNIKKQTTVTQAELNKQSRLRELALKAALDGYNIDTEAQIAAFKEIAEDEKQSLGIRLSALADYNRLSNEQAQKNADFEKQILEEKVQRNQASAEQVANVDKALAAEQQKILKDTGRIQRNIIKQNVDARILDILDASEKEKQALQQKENEELEQLERLYKNSNLTIEQYELAQLQIRNKYATMAVQAEIEATKQILEIRRARGEDVRELENKLFDLEENLRALGRALFKKNEEYKTKTEKEQLDLRKKQQEEFHDRLIELGGEVVNFFFEANKAQFENEKNRIADEIELVKKRKKEEIDAVNATTLSAQEKADRIAVIEARAQAQEEQLEARRRQIQLEQARFERAQAISGIILNTALAVIKTLAVGGPFAIPLAAAIGAIGAVQLATALATPLPRYFMGREDGPSEMARLNDGGRLEVVEHPDGSAYVPQGYDVPVWLNKGDKVHKSIDDYVQDVGERSHRRAPAMEVNSRGELQIRQDLERQTREMVGAIERNKATMVVNNTWGGVMVTQQNAAGFLRYLHKNVYE